MAVRSWSEGGPDGRGARGRRTVLRAVRGGQDRRHRRGVRSGVYHGDARRGALAGRARRGRPRLQGRLPRLAHGRRPHGRVRRRGRGPRSLPGLPHRRPAITGRCPPRLRSRTEPPLHRLLQGRGRPDRRPPDGLRPDGTARPARRDPGRRRLDVDRLPAAGARPGRAPNARWSTGTGRSPPRSSRSTNRTASWRSTVGTVPREYRGLADLVIGVHFAYLAVLVFGGLAAARWRKLLWLHLAAVVWALGSLTVCYDCPLTSLE